MRLIRRRTNPMIITLLVLIVGGIVLATGFACGRPAPDPTEEKMSQREGAR